MQFILSVVQLVGFVKLKAIGYEFNAGVKMDDAPQSKLLSGRGYCEQVRGLMEI